ncbi:MAG TPA: CPBP family intramembrane glutamic endopeptidase [Terriglobales bacterium]|nr:CPBP family intramembrane glutamic endopeptidase [Terriglobales bacterium]
MLPETTGDPLAAPAPTVDQPSTPQRTVVLLHLALLLAILLAFSYVGAEGQQRTVERFGRPAFYTATILWEWLLLAYVWVGMRRQRLTMAEITGGRWKSPEDVLLDLALAAGFWFIAVGVLVGVGFLLGLAQSATHAGQETQALKEAMKKIGFLAPANTRELILFLVLAATAGFCEEIIFRGYLQRLFTTLTRSSFAGMALSAAVFGASHGYQGAARMVQIGVFGLLFGILAHFRKNLRPGMIAHAWHDSIVGIFLYILQRVLKT